VESKKHALRNTPAWLLKAFKGPNGVVTVGGSARPPFRRWHVDHFFPSSSASAILETISLTVLHRTGRPNR
jgi:hypothetical protein